MNSFLGRIQGKLQEARISDVNHELGKVKENLVSESSAYWNSFRSEAASVGSLIRSESTRFSQLWNRGGAQKEGGDQQQQEAPFSSIPKSVSLPAISPGKGNLTKYKYKSSVCGDDLQSPLEEEESADHFIRVLEKKVEEGGAVAAAAVAAPRQVTQRAAPSTREEIRKKLALFGSEEEEEEEEKSERRTRRGGGGRKGPAAGGDLEVCFINQAVTEDEEEEEEEANSSGYKLKEDSSEDDTTSSFPKTKNDWDSIRNLEGSAAGEEEEEEQEERARTALRKRLSQLHRELRVNLADCKEIARSHVEKERARRRREDPLKALVGLAKHEVTEGRLRSCGVASLQVIAEHFHSEIERLNEELVALLITKDELEIEQDSQLLDVEDLTHSLGRTERS